MANKETFIDTFSSKLKKKKKRMTIYLSPEIAKKLKIYAAENDKKISEIIEDALTLKLQNIKTS